MKITTRFWNGLFIGIISILPGVSGSIVAMSLGLYDKLLYAVTNLWIDFKKQFSFLFPIGLGFITAFFFLSKPIDFIVTTHELIAKAFFLGITSMSIVRLSKIVIVKIKNSSKKSFIGSAVALLLGLVTVYLLTFLETMGTEQTLTDITITSMLLFVIIGIIDSFAKVVPGVSSSSIMMALGLYSAYLQVIYQLNFILLFFLALGLIIGGSLTAQIMSRVLKRYPFSTYMYIIGIGIASIFNLIPNQFNLIVIMWVIMGAVTAFFFD